MVADTSSLYDLHQVYNYVVVGGGTAGSVVANRLSEDPRFSVLVLEAGGNSVGDPRITLPGLAANTYFDPEFDWCLTSTPQEALNGRRIAEPRGRTLGGSSAINLGMAIYPRNSGWNWGCLSGYIRKSQTFTPPSDEIRDQLSLDYIDPAVQGTSGPVHVSFGNGPFSAFNAAWPRTFDALNHRLTGDPIHAGVAYYDDEAAQRINLRVVTEALVERIILDKTREGDVIATGVQFVGKDGIRRAISAATEVIMAAGAIKTPHLLELSGIGNADLLQTHGIEPLINNPNVGENLQEHGFVPFSWEVADGQVTGEALRDPEIAKVAMEAWQSSGAGPLGLCPISSAFMTLPELRDGELQGLLKRYLDKEVPQSRTAQYQILRQLLEDAPAPRESIYGMSEPECFVSIVAVLNRPFSRGFVHLSSPDPTVLPIFDPKMLSHPLDLELQARHVRWLETLAETEPMASLLKPNGRRLHHPKQVSSLETARELTRDRIVAHYHVVGTAAMMPRDLGGVVDDQLMVYGCRNLRVVDASIIPLIPRGNIQATVFAVAEKAADIIKGADNGA
ncbi:aryl-alcohol dehydrogenase [Aspergillus heteromorphus CBS 117.55]|uniref:Aryl-alcohol dehydrogenase n=1 Tax=Aspergillus heteromorphus CBS 117.55 TaxID=1448321 RepID=A0A317WTL0_9EURO|nr:aryl-alcohol dehydrogenase [Aspergillus heteromorphus CBS 117.55]PWY88278.1 aryl-alcohol dehydrogenase [Aspergillus heteromorphus CBS 117.55]